MLGVSPNCAITIQLHTLKMTTMRKLLLLFVVASIFLQDAECFWEGDIVFEDNFDGNSLNLSKWEYQEACDHRYGGHNLQCYTRRNVQVKNGMLVITARKEKMEHKEFTSGRIRQRSEFKYGAFVARAKMARGDHLHPAVWLYPHDNYCRYEEIDIAEYRGQASQARTIVHAAHWGRDWENYTSQDYKGGVPEDLSQDFHEFAVLWVPSKIAWYVNQVKYFEVPLTDGTFTRNPNKLPCRGGNQPFDHPNNFILNMAVGGNFFRDFPPMNLATWTKPTFEVDWVRIYQEK